MHIEKVYKENMPQVKLVGKRFTNNDRDENGTFAGYWQQSFKDKWFDILKQTNGALGVTDDYIGAMRMVGGDVAAGFEYWIGMFRATDAEVPNGFDSVEIPSGEIGVCWLCGNEKSGELYGLEASDLSMAAMKEQGWEYVDTGWFFERYNNTRFSEPDADGNVIIDICAYLI